MASTKSHWEIREISFAKRSKLEDATTALNELAEYGNWELYRTRIYPDGRKRVWIKRRIIKIVRPNFII